jgi:hypothetical protein
VANKAHRYAHGGVGVPNEGIHRFTTDNNGGTSSGVGGSIVDILAPSTATNIFQCRQADGTVVLNIGYSGTVTLSNLVDQAAETATLTTTTATQIAAFPATFLGAKLIIQVADTVSGARQISELLLVHDGTTVTVTEFGIVYTNASLATYTAEISGSDIIVKATSASTNNTVYKVMETLL